jgi:hypothetical protein
LTPNEIFETVADSSLFQESTLVSQHRPLDSSESEPVAEERVNSNTNNAMLLISDGSPQHTRIGDPTPTDSAFGLTPFLHSSWNEMGSFYNGQHEIEVARQRDDIMAMSFLDFPTGYTPDPAPELFKGTASPSGTCLTVTTTSSYELQWNLPAGRFIRTSLDERSWRGQVERLDNEEQVSYGVPNSYH